MQAVGMAGAGMGLAGTVMSGVGNFMSKGLEAKMLSSEADNVVRQAAFDETQFRRKAKIEAGSNIAAAAASGVDITKGSPLFEELDFFKQAEIQAQSIRRAGKYQADQLRFKSRLMKQSQMFNAIDTGFKIFGGDKQTGYQGILSQLSGTGKEA